MLADLSRTPFSEVLRKVATERRSGDLQVTTGKTIKSLALDNGRVVFAASNLKKDRLGEALVASGRITAEQFDAASALLRKDRTKRFGDALIQAGILEKKDLGGSVAKQVKRIVLSLFPVTDGVAALDERPCAVPLEFMVSVSVPRLLFEGIKAMTSEPLVMSGLGNLDRRVKLGAITPFEFDPKDAEKDEMEILEAAQRRVSLRRLAWVPGGLSFERLRATYALVASGLLVDADRVDAEPMPLVQMETGLFLLSALQHQPDPSAKEAIRREVEDEVERSARLDRETWLKVSRQAPREELVKALEDKMERYHALLDATGDDKGLRTDIELILGRASGMLRLARQAPVEEPAPAAPAAAASAAAAPPATPSSSAAAPPAEPSASAAVAAPGASAFEGNAQIEHLLMEGEVRMTVSDYANAVKVFAKLVDLAPKVAAFRTRLAIAMASWPRTAKQAEREFLEALRLEPDNADVHYQFGMYYKIMRQRARALAEMQTAVRLNRRHALARREVEVLSSEPGSLGLINLKKLFK